MIVLSAALLLAVILYLIDKNEKWPIAWLYTKRIIAALGVVLLLFALHVVYDIYERNRIAKATESESAARAKAYGVQQAQEQRDVANAGATKG